MTGIQDACFEFFRYRKPNAEFILKAILNAPLDKHLKEKAKKVVTQEYEFTLLAVEACKAAKTRTVSRTQLFHKALRIIKSGGMNITKSKARRLMLKNLQALRRLHLNEVNAIWVLIEGMKNADVVRTTDTVIV